LLATFAILIGVSVGVTSVLNNVAYRQITTQNIQLQLQQVQAAVAQPLAEYYLAHGRSLAGVDQWLDAQFGDTPGPGGRFTSYLVWDANGNPVAVGGAHQIDPATVSPNSGTPILVGSTQVGTLLLVAVQGPPDHWRGGMQGQRRRPGQLVFPSSPRTADQEQRAHGRPTPPVAAAAPRSPLAPWEVEQRVGRSFGFVALVIGSLMLGFAVVVSRRISAPLARLTGAARQIAGGDLRVDVPRSSIQEVDTLAQAFGRMASDLMQADQLRRNMTADIAHELRTPLTIIKGKLEGILDGVYPGTAEHLAPVLEEANLLERLIDDLRLLSLAEAGQLPLVREELDIADLLYAVQKSFVEQASRQGIALAIDVESALPPVQGDWQRMQQVLGNLVANSLRYTPAGGRIDLQGRRNGPWITVVVRDTGAGIAPEELPHIFDRFWRSDKARSRHGTGAGLGLAIARQFVQAQGGRISATSQPGHGTTITVELPAEGTGNREQGTGDRGTQ
jgi:signal transduction histidine kinase